MIEFNPKEHIYKVNGERVLSVTQIIKMINPNKYEGVSPSVLERASRFGTEGHKIIERMDPWEFYDIGDIPNKDLQICIREYLRLVKRYNIHPLIHEMMVSHRNIYAGCLDMIATVDGATSLIDIKFTSKLDREYLEWQLGMYSMACIVQFEKYYCLWLPKKELGQLVEITPKSVQEIREKLEELGLCQ